MQFCAQTKPYCSKVCNVPSKPPSNQKPQKGYLNKQPILTCTCTSDSRIG